MGGGAAALLVLSKEISLRKNSLLISSPNAVEMRHRHESILTDVPRLPGQSPSIHLLSHFALHSGSLRGAGVSPSCLRKGKGGACQRALSRGLRSVTRPPLPRPVSKGTATSDGPASVSAYFLFSSIHPKPSLIVVPPEIKTL